MSEACAVSRSQPVRVSWQVSHAPLGKAHSVGPDGRLKSERAQRNVDKLQADAHASELTSLSEFLEYFRTLRDVSARERINVENWFAHLHRKRLRSARRASTLERCLRRC